MLHYRKVTTRIRFIRYLVVATYCISLIGHNHATSVTGFPMTRCITRLYADCIGSSGADIDTTSLDHNLTTLYAEGKTAFNNGKWEEALRKFQCLNSKYSNHPYAEETQLHIIVCLCLDQSSVEKIFTAINKFSAQYPNSKWREDVLQLRDEMQKSLDSAWQSVQDTLQQQKKKDYWSNIIQSIAIGLRLVRPFLDRY